MSVIQDQIMTEKRNRGFAFIPYLMSSFPDTEKFLKYGKILSKYSKVMEIGIPYSDPVADGPVIQEAHRSVLQKNKSIRELISVTSEIKAEKVIMTYFNPVHRLGAKNYFKLLNDTGIKGTLIPDLPVELSRDLMAEAKGYGIDIIFLVSPNTSAERMKIIAENSTGFIYVVQRYGVTGESDEVYLPIKGVISALKNITQKPISVGFGISKFEHILKLVDMGTDGVVVGSHLIKMIEKGVNYEEFEKNIQILLNST